MTAPTAPLSRPCRPGGENVTFKNGPDRQRRRPEGRRTGRHDRRLAGEPRVRQRRVPRRRPGDRRRPQRVRVLPGPRTDDPQLDVHNCATMDLFMLRGDWWGQVPYGGITLENNVFGHSGQRRRLALLRPVLVQRRVPERPVVNNTFESAVIHSERRRRAVLRRVGQQHRRRLGLPGRRDLPQQHRQHVPRVRPRRLRPSTRARRPPAPARVAPVGWANPAANDFRLDRRIDGDRRGRRRVRLGRDDRAVLRDARPDVGAYEFGAAATTWLCRAAGTSGRRLRRWNGGDEGGARAAASGGTAAAVVRIRSARLDRASLCRARPRKGCPARTRLRVALTAPAQRVRAVRAPAGRAQAGPLAPDPARHYGSPPAACARAATACPVTAGAAERTLTLRVRT